MSVARIWFLVGGLSSVSLIGIAYFMQYVMGLEPCPLCHIQRGIFILIAIVFFFAVLHNPKRIGRKIYSIVLLLVSLLGVLVSGRHVWLQAQAPDTVASCGADLAYLIDTLPFLELITFLYNTSGECNIVQWSFLSLSIPAWALVWFVIYTGFSIYLFSISSFDGGC